MARFPGIGRKLIVAAALTGCIAAGKQVKVLSVCEALANTSRFSGRFVAVVGRMESRVGLIDRQDFLSQDHCEHPVVSYGHVWSNEILIWIGQQPGMPKPPTEGLQLEPSILAG